MSSASTQAAGAVAPAARLSEEAMDSVCAFVREDEEDQQETADTLRALALVHRRWTPSAVRALWHDPSFAFTRRQDGGEKLLNQLLTKPHRAVQVRSLERLADVFGRAKGWGAGPVAPGQQNWLLAVLLACPNLSTLALSSDMSAAASTSPSLRQIRHLIVQPHWRDDFGDSARPFEEVNSQTFPHLEEITYRGMYCEVAMWLSPRAPHFDLPIRRLNFQKSSLCDVCLTAFLSLTRPSSRFLRHLRIEGNSGRMAGVVSDFLRPTLETFEYCPTDTRMPPGIGLDDYGRSGLLRYSCPYLPPSTALTRLVLEFAYLELEDLEKTSSHFPFLEFVSFYDSTWEPSEWLHLCHLDYLLPFLHSLRQLSFLSLGYLPLFTGAAKEDFDVFCMECEAREVTLRYRTPEYEEEELAFTEYEGSAASEVDSAADMEGWEALEADDLRFWQYSSSIVLRPSLFTPPTSLDISPFSRSPTPEVSFLDEPPVEPRLEPDFEAEDEADEEDVEVEERRWREWDEDDEDWEQGDRRWRELEWGTE